MGSPQRKRAPRVGHNSYVIQSNGRVHLLQRFLRPVVKRAVRVWSRGRYGFNQEDDRGLIKRTIRVSSRGRYGFYQEGDTGLGCDMRKGERERGEKKKEGERKKEEGFPALPQAILNNPRACTRVPRSSGPDIRVSKSF